MIKSIGSTAGHELTKLTLVFKLKWNIHIAKIYIYYAVYTYPEFKIEHLKFISCLPIYPIWFKKKFIAY